jgi:undecaprenyl diphosphate synthase
VQAARRVQSEGRELTEESLGGALYTDGCPDPDLIVRTGGEMRISNFLLWQAAYAELYFTDTLWPDMREKDVDAAVEAFRNRNRRYGGV